MKKKTLKNKFKWTPVNERLDNIGQPIPPRPVDQRKPKLWLTIPLKNQDETTTLESYDVYLVNSSGITLKSVIVDSGGWYYFDDELINSTQTDYIEYKDIENGDAIKVFTYVPFHDDDEQTWMSLKIIMDGNDIEFSTSYNQRTKKLDKEVVL